MGSHFNSYYPLNMRSFVNIFILFLFAIFGHCPNSKATTLFSPITKDDSTNLYSMLIYLKTPLQPSKLHLDLGSYLSWYDCTRHYKSSSYEPVLYNSSLCLDLDTKVYGNCFDPPGPGCSNDTCESYPQNPVTLKGGTGSILTDRFALPLSTKKPVQLGPVSDIVFSCTRTNIYKKPKIYRGLAKGSTGLAALGWFNYSLPAILSRSFSSPNVFAVCLPSSSNSTGIVVFNSPGPYYFSPDRSIDMSKFLVYTPLIVGPRGADTRTTTWYKSPDYYIGLSSIQVNHRVVPFNQTLLVIDENGGGGTRLSSSRPFTVLQTSIFKALNDAFVKESALLNLKPIVNATGLQPFTVCYGADEIRLTRLGPDVPTIDLVLGSTGNVLWRIYGSNSMVRVKNANVDAWCLGFVDGGSNPSSTIMIGGHQMEDNLLQIDLVKERLGFSSSLLSRSTSCANYVTN